MFVTSVMLSFAATAQARVGEVNDWSLFQHDGSCAAITTYGRDMMVRVAHDRANNIALLTLARPIWRAIEEGREYPIRIELSNGRYYASPPNYGIVFGEGDERQAGISIRLNGDEFLADFAGSASMQVKLDGTLIASLNLRGTRDVMRQVTACSARAFRQDTRDPFASLPPASPPPSRYSTAPGTIPVRRRPNTPFASPPPTPARLRSGSISNADYPSSAIRSGASGTTRITVSVDANGRATGCTVSGSSGNSSLDSTACSLAQRRFRFTPATANGLPVAGTYTQSVRWILPVDPNQIWVQLSVGPNRSDFQSQVNRLRQVAPDFASYAVHTSPVAEVHRLIIGPFASEAEALTAVLRLQELGFSPTTWTNPAGAPTPVL